MKVKEVREHYKQKNVESFTIEKAIELDRTPTKKYVNYILKQFMRGYSIYETSTDVKLFEDLLPNIENKDIYSSDYDSLMNLKRAIETAKTKVDLKRYAKEMGKFTYILKETDDYILLHPKNFEASRKYGYNTRWCVTSSDSYYQDYRKNLVFLIIKNGVTDRNYQKIALHSRNGNDYSIYNADDSTVGDLTIRTKLQNVKIDWDEITTLFTEFIERNKGGWFKKYLPWTLRYKVGY